MALLAALTPLLTEGVYRRPVAMFTLLRESPEASQILLWAGWFATALVVFGLADAITTHPCYLVGVAVPLAAVAGIGLSVLWNGFKPGGAAGWLLVAALIGGAVYQVYAARGEVADWVMAVVLIALLAASLVMATAIQRKLTALPLSAISVGVAIISILLIPLAVGEGLGGQIAGPGAGLARAPSGVRANPEGQRVQAISSLLRQEEGSLSAIATISAREAAPYIIADLPALAIGGFSGNDPIFTLDSFRALVDRGELRYFLMPGAGGVGGPPGRSTQEQIVDFVRRTWEDVSLRAGLPMGTLYRHRASSPRP